MTMFRLHFFNHTEEPSPSVPLFFQNALLIKTTVKPMNRWVLAFIDSAWYVHSRLLTFRPRNIINDKLCISGFLGFQISPMDHIVRSIIVINVKNVAIVPSKPFRYVVGSQDSI
jgi:hypothetical protein